MAKLKAQAKASKVTPGPKTPKAMNNEDTKDAKESMGAVTGAPAAEPSRKKRKLAEAADQQQQPTRSDAQTNGVASKEPRGAAVGGAQPAKKTAFAITVTGDGKAVADADMADAEIPNGIPPGKQPTKKKKDRQSEKRRLRQEQRRLARDAAAAAAADGAAADGAAAAAAIAAGGVAMAADGATVEGAGDAAAVAALEAAGPTDDAEGLQQHAAGADGTVEQYNEKKKKKKDKKKKKKTEAPEQPSNHAATAATAAATAADGDGGDDAMPGPASKGNAEEAQRLRATLGFIPDASATATSKAGGSSSQAPANSATTAAAGIASTSGKGGFAFGFSVEEQVELETQEKLARIMMVDSSKDGFVPRRVFVCGMPHEFSEDDIHEYWAYCGEIESLDCMKFADSGNFNGVCFITFKTQQGYESALECNGVEENGRYIRVEKCKIVAESKAKAGQPSKDATAASAAAQRVEGYNVAYVGNVPYEATDADLMELFKPFGAMRVRLHTDKVTGKSKGFAHVHFPDGDSLEKSMAVNGTRLHGRSIKVGFAQPKKQDNGS